LTRQTSGAWAVGLATLLAIGSVPTGVLRSTVIHGTRLFYDDVPDTVVPNAPLLLCIAYWAVFAAAFGASLYFAVLDIRYIRLQYALEKRRLFEQSLALDRAERERAARENEDAGPSTG